MTAFSGTPVCLYVCLQFIFALRQIVFEHDCSCLFVREVFIRNYQHTCCTVTVSTFTLVCQSKQLRYEVTC